MMEIVKVQRPLVGDDWLVYAKGRVRSQVLPKFVIPAYVREKMGDDLKGYFEARWSSIVGWAIGDRVAEQEW